MRSRGILFGLLCGIHLAAVLFTPEFLAPAIAGTIYLPLMPFNFIELPVFGSAESGGWAAPSLLGWAIDFIFWVVVWWALASFLQYIYLNHLKKNKSKK